MSRLQDHFNVIVRHCTATLPDSVSERRKVLDGLLNVLPVAHPLRRDVRTLLGSLDTHLAFQREFPFSDDATNGGKP